jgi:hypothetical protein
LRCRENSCSAEAKFASRDRTRHFRVRVSPPQPRSQVSVVCFGAFNVGRNVEELEAFSRAIHALFRWDHGRPCSRSRHCQVGVSGALRWHWAAVSECWRHGESWRQSGRNYLWRGIRPLIGVMVCKPPSHLALACPCASLPSIVSESRTASAGWLGVIRRENEQRWWATALGQNGQTGLDHQKVGEVQRAGCPDFGCQSRPRP